MIVTLTILLGISGLLVIWWVISRLRVAAKERKIMLEYVEMNAKLELLNRNLRRDHERTYRAIARRLHDDIGAETSSAKLMLTALARTMEGDEFTLYLNIKSSLDRVIAQARSISQDLYPACLQMAGLDAALQELCERMHQPRWSAVEYKSSGLSRRLDIEHEEVLYRSVRELIINSQKHALAWKIQVSSQWMDKGLKIDVLDDGRGWQAYLNDGKTSGHKMLADTLERIRAGFQIVPSQRGFHATIMYRAN
ncbi:MAG: sensor histidine kinase [Cyclobacteriaceae bacterium]